MTSFSFPTYFKLDNSSKKLVYCLHKTVLLLYHSHIIDKLEGLYRNNQGDQIRQFFVNWATFGGPL